MARQRGISKFPSRLSVVRCANVLDPKCFFFQPARRTLLIKKGNDKQERKASRWLSCSSVSRARVRLAINLRFHRLGSSHRINSRSPVTLTRLPIPGDSSLFVSNADTCSPSVLVGRYKYNGQKPGSSPRINTDVSRLGLANAGIHIHAVHEKIQSGPRFEYSQRLDERSGERGILSLVKYVQAARQSFLWDKSTPWDHIVISSLLIVAKRRANGIMLLQFPFLGAEWHSRLC